MTRLITSILGKTPAELLGKAQAALAAHSDSVELRFDRLATVVRAAEAAGVLSALPPDSWVATLRSVEEGGGCSMSAVERLDLLRAATAGLRGTVDFEYCSWTELPSELRKTWEDAHGAVRLILSSHHFEGPRPNAARLVDEIVTAFPQTVAKIAWRGHSAADNLVALEIMRQHGDQVIAIVMGECGLASRVLAKKFGAAATYCSWEAGAEAAPGQVTLERMRGYRWQSIRPSTRVYGVLGDPVGHSMSPVLFNAAFARHTQDAVYLPWHVPGGEAGLAELLDACERRPWLDVGGFSVTLPHKEAARRHVGARADALAARIGSVNTLALRGGGFFGFNTDYSGALEALCAALRREAGDLRGVTVDVLGAGGAARAVVAALADSGCRVAIYNRDADRAAALALEFGGSAGAWDDREHGKGRVVVNCTSLGMFPQAQATPLPHAALAGRTLVFDTVYNPPETRLLREARAAGCTVLGGVEMFIRQAAAQYELWFGARPELSNLREIAIAALNRPAES